MSDSPLPPKIGQQELGVLQFVQQAAPVTVRETADHFVAAGKVRTTVLTMMERLRKKGLLTREHIDGAYHYSPSITATELMQSLVGRFVDQMLGGSVSPFLAYMSETGEISDEELGELKQLVRDLEQRPEEGKDS